MTHNKRELGQALDQYRIAAKAVLDRRGGDKTAADWALYTAAAASAMSLAGSVEAAIVYSGVQNLSVTRAATAPGSAFTTVDFDADGSPNVGVGIYFGTGNGGSVAAYGYAGRQFIGTGLFASKLSSGATIGPAGPFVANPNVSSYAVLRYQYAGGTNGGDWDPNDTGLAGVRLRRGTDIHYAWLRLALTSDAIGPSELTVVDWAWEDQADTAIAAGVVPLPGSLGFLAAGAAGLALLRRRRKPV